ncbi:MAG TPA: LPS export ABC transporter periplasmic protein LptC [Xanthobacteraceae bacterium]|nr:LPS export ABC transporter periplasmic protein LptC [Xanthobacteraceae bacterium]
MRETVSYDDDRGWRADDRAERGPAFRRAQRHSRLVRWLRWGIPIAALAGIVLNALGGWIAGQALNLPAMGPLAVSGSKVTMDRPRLAGYTRDGRAYEIHAESADQDMRKPQVIGLNAVRTKLQLRDGRTVTISAETGTYDTKREVVALQKNVICVASDGTEMRLAEAVVDVRSGHVVSRQPVEVVQPRARIVANSMEVAENGAVVVFQGGVKFTATDPGETSAAARGSP